MTPELLWKRYAAIWSSDVATRTTELEACLADPCHYCDPNGLIVGRSALSDYMGNFQRAVQDGRFEILMVAHHHSRMLAEWVLRSAAGKILQTGRSFAVVAEDGRFESITGFFDDMPRLAV
ncbi:MAG: nuclear transport factor 2 family protein [Proteobacteria bacterium]|nr:nuclear transport factor 2 family protein [Pseudomonadota bacterium]